MEEIEPIGWQVSGTGTPSIALGDFEQTSAGAGFVLAPNMLPLHV